MLTEEQLEALGDRITGLYQQLEQDVIADIARRVKKTGRFTETAELMVRSMVEKGASAPEIRKEVMKLLRVDAEYKKTVANNTKQYKRDVMHEIHQTEKRAKELGDEIIANAGDMSYNKDLIAWHQVGEKLTKNSAFPKLVEEMSKFTEGTLKNLTRTTGFKVSRGFISANNAYTGALDRALMKMISGTFSFDQAANDCVRELARSGLRSVDYASGRSYQLDTAARMCIRTSCHQLSARICMNNCEEMGTDLVEVSAHWGARPDHVVWQGKVYSRSGKNKKYPNFSECHYEEVTGLCGINCRHTFYPFFEGSVPNEWPDEPVPKEYKGKTYDYYASTQKQRTMERNIRATKRELEAQKILGGDTAELRSRLRAQTKEYHQFSNVVGIKAKDNRLRVVAGSSDITKTKAYKNTVKMSKTGANGAYTNKTDPLGRKREKHAIEYYEEIKNRKQKNVVSSMANNVGISEKQAQNIYEHIFVNEHIFRDGSLKKFDPDYNMAESFRRILEGKNIKPHDIVLIKHENLELNLMKRYNIPYEDAHELAKKKYDYNSALNKFLDEAGD